MRRICIYCQTWESGGIEAFINNTEASRLIWPSKSVWGISILKAHAFMRQKPGDTRSALPGSCPPSSEIPHFSRWYSLMF